MPRAARRVRKVGPRANALPALAIAKACCRTGDRL